MGSVLKDGDRRAICQRIATITGASVPRWGHLDARSMLAHLRRGALMALGELHVACTSKRVFQVFPVKHLILHVVPFPNGAPTAPELLGPAPGSLEAIRSDLVSLVERFGAGTRQGDAAAHPLFGPLSFHEWGVATYKHTDHHLRQFGA
jgi:hypothetical protein